MFNKVIPNAVFQYAFHIKPQFQKESKLYLNGFLQIEEE
jgi:hypothetical protein